MGSKCASEQCWKNLALKIENFKLKIDAFRECDFKVIKSPRFCGLSADQRKISPSEVL